MTGGRKSTDATSSTAALETLEQLGGKAPASVSGRATTLSPGETTRPALTVLYHPDVARVGELVILGELAAGVACSLSRTAPGFAPRSDATRGGAARAGRPLEDQNLSRSPLRLTAIAGGGGVRVELGECRTRVAAGGEPLRGSIDFSAEDVQRGVVLELAGRIVLLLHAVPAGAGVGAFTAGAEERVLAELVGESAAMQRLKQDIRRVADLDVPVLIRGETGSGKELVAHALHLASGRRRGPYEAVNLGEVPASLASATLFGAERGSHSMADRRQLGYFRQAHDGTLFLDEVGETPPEVQVALLRVLETGEIRPLGADQTQKVDVRILAATDAALEEKIEEGSFRAPLLYRLASYEIWVPPVRERRDDIGRLLIHFFRQELSNPKIGEAHRLESAPRTGELWLPASLVARLANFDWPGNVRQLRNAVRQIVIHSRMRDHAELPPSVERMLSAGGHPRPQLPAPAPPPARGREPQARSALPSAPPPAQGCEPQALSALPERRKPGAVTDEELEAALREARWDRTAAAAALRVSRTSLYALLEKSQRFRTEDVTPEEVSHAWRECGGDVERMVDRLHVSERTIRWRLRKLGLEESGGHAAKPRGRAEGDGGA